MRPPRRSPRLRQHGVLRPAGALLAACVALSCAMLPTPARAAGANPSPSGFILGPLPGQLLVAGFLPFEDADLDRWAWSGAWLYPVGNPYRLDAPGADGAPAFVASRGVSSGSAGRHDGADLLNGRRGDPVRAAAHGIVVRAARSTRGYGAQIVLGHRLDDGTLAYSVYAHLDPASLLVRRGARVHAGQSIARVGRSGRATTAHLHFEVRVPQDATTRWEHAPVTDPLAFVAERLPSGSADTTWARPYLEWAQCGALVGGGAVPGAELTRAQWWSVLARAARHDLHGLPDDTGTLRDRLIGAEVLAPTTDRSAVDEAIGWDELSGDLARLRSRGVRLPGIAIERPVHRHTVETRLAGYDGGAAGAPPASPPTLADALLAIADLVLEAPETHR